ncbi:MAG TPA: AsmA-like C-terminal region-containing protein, partial [Gemmataceae bacterium]
MRRRRWLWVLVPLVLVVLAFLGVWAFLQTSYAAAMVAERLRPLLGGAVQVDGLSVGVGGTTARGVRVWGGDAADGEPWLSAREVRADVSLFDILTGDVAPGALTVEGAEVNVRLDREGNLVTRLPRSDGAGGSGQIPAVRVADGSLRVTQEGYAEPILDATGVGGEVKPVDGVLSLSDLRARLAGGTLTGAGTVHLRGDDRRMAFQVRAEGLDVEKFPQNWDFPARFGGKLTGHADIVLSIEDGELKPRGTGKGRLVGATFAGFPADVQVFLRGDGEELRFETEAAEAGAGEEKSDARPALAPLAGLVLAALFGQDPPKGQEPAPEKDGTSYVEIQLGLKEVDLAELLKRLEVKLPYKLGGTLTIQVRVGIPTDAIRELRAYRFTGTVELPTFQLETLKLREARAHVTYRDGVLRLDELSGRMPVEGGAAGSFAGTAQVGVDPATDLTAELKLTDIPAAEILGALTGAAENASGRVSGTASFTAPAGRLTDPAAWDAKAELRSGALSAFNWTWKDAVLRAALAEGKLTVAELGGTVEGTPLRASGELFVVPPYTFRADVRIDKADLAALNHLAPGLRPPVRVEGTLTTEATAQGSLAFPERLLASGTGSAAGLKVAEFPLGKADFAWKLAPDRLVVRSLSVNLPQGELTGSADIPLGEAKKPGRAEVRFKDVDLGALTKQVPDFPVRLEGVASGTVTAEIPPPGADQAVSAKLAVSAPKLRVRNIPAERLQGTATYSGGVIRYDLQGETLGGTFEVEGTYPLFRKEKPAEPPPPEPGPRGRLSLREADLSALWKALGAGDALADLTGVASLELDYRFAEGGAGPAGDGRVTLRRLRWGGNPLAEELQGRVRLDGASLSVSDIGGGYAGGQLSGDVGVDLARGRGKFSVRVRGARAGRVLRPVPPLAEEIEGTMNLFARGTIGRQVTGHGTAVLTRGTALGVEVTEWRLPFDFYAAARGGQFRSSGTYATVARGRASGRFTYRWGYTDRLEGNAEFSRVDLRTLLRPFTDTSLGNGRANGRVEFSADRLESVNDLTLHVHAHFPQTQPFGLPVLRQLTPYVRTARSHRAGGGELQATLTGGTFRIRELSLSGRTYQMFIEGNVGLDGRLGLNVIINTAQL